MWYHGFEWSCAVCEVCHGHFHPALWVDLCGCGAMCCVRMFKDEGCEGADAVWRYA